MLAKLITLTALVFLLGWLSHGLYAEASQEPQSALADQAVSQASFQEPAIAQAGANAAEQASTQAQAPAPLSTYEPGDRERLSPSDWLSLDDVHVTDARVTVDAPSGRRFETAIYTNTNSMDPWIDENSQGIYVIPHTESDITPGNVIAYAPGNGYGVFIHQVISTGTDEQGWYAIVKGINNPTPDPVKVRFNMVRRVLVGVLY